MKPIEKSQKQTEMLNAYKASHDDREWPPLSLTRQNEVQERSELNSPKFQAKRPAKIVTPRLPD